MCIQHTRRQPRAWYIYNYIHIVPSNQLLKINDQQVNLLPPLLQVRIQVNRYDDMIRLDLAFVQDLENGVVPRKGNKRRYINAMKFTWLVDRPWTFAPKANLNHSGIVIKWSQMIFVNIFSNNPSCKAPGHEEILVDHEISALPQASKWRDIT